MRLHASVTLALLTFNGGVALAGPLPAPTQAMGTAADGTRYYEDTLVIRAPAATLFAAFTQAAEFRKWSLPVSAIDFRLGGVLEASIDPKGHLGDPGNIKNQIIAYVPDRLVVFRNIQAPPMLPDGGDYPKTVKTIEFQTLGKASTRVTISGIGFGAGPGFSQLYAFFADEDREMLVALREAYAPK